ncbi:MAG: undecaprenyl/decaprenyl-phosphate alpha-N-acetylglucosaminyl 1-phosphate transferase [bacterium]|nr:undecaprenyl/decaprenyl-phosphate alpha-N-acetylglucosaminyl 1-phosphate transferase [bacterium]
MIYTIYIILVFVIVIGFAGSYWSHKITLNLAAKYRIYDDFNHRKIAKEPRPRLGGIGIFFGFILSFYILFFVIYLLQGSKYHIYVDFSLFQIMLYICSMIIFFLLGLYDDFKGLKALQKLGIELAVATILFYIGFKIELLTLPFMTESINAGAFSYPLTVIWIIGIVNAINLIDGLDGLAGGVIAIVSVTIIVICVLFKLIFPAIIISALLGGVLGFLPYNFYPSKILMGDGGSLFAGAVLATISLKTAHKASLGIALMIPIIFLAIPVLDTGLSFSRRLLSGKNPLKGDNDHIHHRLMRKGFSEKKSAVILLTLTGVFSILSIVVSYFRGTLRFVALVISLVLAILLILYLNYINFRFKRRRNGNNGNNNGNKNGTADGGGSNGINGGNSTGA